jgi:protein-tyrosine phosphatase
VNPRAIAALRRGALIHLPNSRICRTHACAPAEDRLTVLDLHCHILPDVDDGAESLDVSVAMLDAARRIGIRTIVATPHLTERLDPGYAATVDAAFRRVEPLAAERGIALERGFEIRLSPDLPRRLRAGEPCTLAGSRVVLVDLPFVDDWPHFVDDTLFDLQASGFLPILAHPERYPHVQRRPEVGQELAGRGIALQVNLASLAGTFGRRARRAAEELLRLGAVHLVATDAHSAGHRMAAVPDGLAHLRKLSGDDGVRRLTVEAPATLLNGDALPQPVIAGDSAPGGLSRLRSLFAVEAR